MPTFPLYLLPQQLLRFNQELQAQFSSQISLFLWLEASPLKSILLALDSGG